MQDDGQECLREAPAEDLGGLCQAAHRIPHAHTTPHTSRIYKKNERKRGARRVHPRHEFTTLQQSTLEFSAISTHPPTPTRTFTHTPIPVSDTCNDEGGGGEAQFNRALL
jgi:hypothetical protein